MHHVLHLHPGSQSKAVSRIDVEIARPAPGLLSLHYRLTGDLQGMVMPFPAAPARTDGLWRHTCFEAFVGRDGGGYDEFNFAPSGQWAAYRFNACREGMRPLGVAPPTIAMSCTEAVFELAATFHIDGGALRLGLCAVIEAADGTLGYWALAHPPGKPDFHHPDCFALQLPAMQRP